VSLLESFDRIGHPRILVLGDLMLDRYTWGVAHRISQEAPVLVLRAENREHRLGGAANVSQMLRVLEADVTCVGVTGDDEAGRTLRGLLSDAQIQVDTIPACQGRPTTVKERFVGRSGSGPPTQMLRVDSETTDALDHQVEARLIELLSSIIPQHDAVLISDYAKGVCTPACVTAAISLARRSAVPVLVDPGRGRDFRIFTGATLVKPNRTETEQATGQSLQNADDAILAGIKLCQQLQIDRAVITLDADGMALVSRDGSGQRFPTEARSVYDITGAGDMVFAMLGICFAVNLDAAAAVQLANVAAGLEVDRTGVATLTRNEIRSELQNCQSSVGRKLLSIDQMARQADEYRRRGKRIVLTNGCFDLLHVGHVTYLEEAAAQADVLVVAINSDESVRRLKGPQRPVIGENERAAMLAALACVDHVVVFSEDTPHELLRAIRPHLLVKGGSYAVHEVVGREVVESYGGRVRVMGLVPGVSTTEIVQTLQRRSAMRQAG
jgi:D-beta-D-heptose 7-phosphate kinase/D-beta-D-heptose 1-phosphate adenosyltransferase